MSSHYDCQFQHNNALCSRTVPIHWMYLVITMVEMALSLCTSADDQLTSLTYRFAGATDDFSPSPFVQSPHAPSHSQQAMITATASPLHSDAPVVLYAKRLAIGKSTWTWLVRAASSVDGTVGAYVAVEFSRKRAAATSSGTARDNDGAI